MEGIEQTSRQTLLLAPEHTIITCLDFYADRTPNAPAYIFLKNGNDDVELLTYQDLRARALSFATFLRQDDLEGERAILLFPSGLDFIIAFLACCYARIICVPANMTRNPNHFRRLNRIIGSAGARAILTTTDLKDTIALGMSKVNGGGRGSIVRIYSEGDAQGMPALQPVRRPDSQDVCFLQYTSGSTGDPKGVIVKHCQLMANEIAIQASVDLPYHMTMAGWLPQFHDMGLVGATLLPLALGGRCVFMSPLHFIQKPVRWLRMISSYRADATPAPNFALDMCITIPETDLDKNLDLSTLQTLFCGAEPVQARTVRRFQERFGPYGLRDMAVKPSYGMAEATLMVSGGLAPEHERILSVDREPFTHGLVRLSAGSDAQDLVCCGYAPDGHSIRIVAVDGSHELEDLQVGEIWFSGPSVASGYWDNPEATRSTFGGLLDGNDRRYLCTGDLGFKYREGLYVTGRIKELIIIRGRNYYPHDIESQVSEVLVDVLGRTRVAAIGADDRAALVLFVEMPRRWSRSENFSFAGIISLIRSHVSGIFELQVKDVVFLSHGKLPFTSSGKLQRRECERAFIEDDPVFREHTLYSTRSVDTH